MAEGCAFVYEAMCVRHGVYASQHEGYMRANWPEESPECSDWRPAHACDRPAEDDMVHRREAGYGHGCAAAAGFACACLGAPNCVWKHAFVAAAEIGRAR